MRRLPCGASSPRAEESTTAVHTFSLDLIACVGGRGARRAIDAACVFCEKLRLNGEFADEAEGHDRSGKQGLAVKHLYLVPQVGFDAVSPLPPNAAVDALEGGECFTSLPCLQISRLGKPLSGPAILSKSRTSVSPNETDAQRLSTVRARMQKT